MGALRVSPGFILICAVSYYFDETGALLFVLLGACVHELGHYFAVRLTGGKIEAVCLSAFGAEMKLKSGLGRTAGQEVFISLAGPLASLLAAGVSVFIAGRFLYDRLYFFAGTNALLGLFNLLPAGCLDGGRAVFYILLKYAGIDAALCSQRVLTAVTSVILLCAGVVLFRYSGYNLSVLAVSGYLLYGLVRFPAGGAGTCKTRRFRVE